MIILTDSCPVCNSKDIEIKTIEYDFPEIGKSLLYIFKCNSCNYRTFEIIPLEDRGYIKIEYKIDNIEKARKLFLKSPYAKIILKEIEIIPLEDRGYIKIEYKIDNIEKQENYF